MKTVIVLTGISEGKNEFDRIIKSHGYWTWNINPNNVLSVASREFGWDGNRDNKHYEFIEKLSLLVDEYYDFGYWYVKTMNEKMHSHEKANVLLIHGVGNDLVENIKEDFGGISIHIAKSEKDFNRLLGAYDKVLLFDEENLQDFEERVLKIMEILTEKEG